MPTSDYWGNLHGGTIAGTLNGVGGTVSGISGTFADLNGTTLEAHAVTTPNHNGILKIYNVLDYGATGGGSVDDSTAIQTAITAAEAANGVVYFPPGTYKLNSTLTGGVNITLKGANRNSVILTGTAAPLLSISYAGMPDNTSAQQAPYLEGLTFKVSTTNAALSITGPGYAVLGQPQPIVRDCTFDARANTQLALIAIVNVVLTYGLIFTGCFWLAPRSGNSTDIRALVLNGTTVTQIQNCDIELFGIGVLAQPQSGHADQGLQIVNCLIDGNIGYGVYLNSEQGGSVTSNTIDNNGAGAVYITSSNSVSVDSNYLGGAMPASSALGTVEIDNSSRIRLTNNDIVAYNDGNYQVYVGRNTAIDKCIISSNTFDGGNSLALIYINLATETLVTNNLSTGSASIALVNYNTTNYPNPTSTVPTFVIKGNSNSPQGFIPSPPGVPSSGVTVKNPFPYDILVGIQAGSSTCTIAINGVNDYLAPIGGFVTFPLPAGGTVLLSYANAPTSWAWFAN